ncbi:MULTISPECIES: hypothetical protein [unclassified Nocardioides]|uniref:hypothetical protein n=1 Tax=unclassified Nocardioides TaxID=2615069 RepID=UPI0007014D76|nr:MULTISPECIES: hypothetical protein [unclassified Nocardioides]KRA39198.1 hypothetical protein ASD81_11795 [Nocardioides sp. Root614]KRA93157.1 hypothetical protein ASD84_12060 [Nocardioides sp. Root682]
MTTSTPTENKPINVKDLLVVMVWLGLPYVIVGVFWADAHHAHVEGLHGMDAFLSYLGEIVAWPLLIFSDITLK